ncbi:MAG: DNA polymerase III subunit gamma/tau [Gammaproteobacteria bacterium]|nr:DNA polymerase III subunit gamma/tau [Gammaproteobacteria bacterium]
MSYQALARKWRPKTFDQVIGQNHVVSALSNALNNQRVHHAFLFTGTRGVGKTTLARIFAKALNCEQGVNATPCEACVACRGVDHGNFIDLIEVDAASRTKVDDTRELLDNVQYAPTQGRYKIYLIDEVHMLSTHSFNALLKTLEEPPAHVKFLLATTDPQKLPTTILSRCIQFNLKSMDMGRLTGQLEKILDAEDIAFDASGVLILARSANGSVRDALSLLDQAIAFGNGEVRVEQVRQMLGMIDERYTRDLLQFLSQGDAKKLLHVVTEMAERSVDFSTGIDELLTMIHNVSLFQVSPEALEWKGLDSAVLAELADRVDAEILQLFYQIGLMGKRDLPLAPDPRTGFEMALLRMLAFKPARPGMDGSQGSNQRTSTSSVSPPQTSQSQTSHSQAARPPAQSVDVTRTVRDSDSSSHYHTDTESGSGVSALDESMANSGSDNGPSQSLLDARSERERRIDRYLSDTENPVEEPNENHSGSTSFGVPGAPPNARDSLEPQRPSNDNYPESNGLHEATSTFDSGSVNANYFSEPDSLNVDGYDELVRGKSLSFENLSDITGWNDFVEHSGLTGMARETVMNMVPKGVEGKIITLSLDTSQKHLFNASRMKKIESHCREVLNIDVTFQIDVEDCEALGQETPSKKREREKRQREADARQAFVHDPNVQEMVDMFDARVMTESIKSPNI